MLKIKFQLSVVAKLLLWALEKVPKVVVDKQGASQDAHDLEHRPVQLEVVFNECDETVRDNGDVDLYPHSILGVTPEPLDAQMLLDPFEKQFHLPTIAVKQRDIFGLEIEVVGVVNEGASKVGDIEYDTPEFGRIVVAIPFACKSNSLVGKHTVSSIKKPLPEQHLIGWMSFLPCDEKRVGLVNGKKPRKVEVAPVENITGKWLIDNAVHELGVVNIGVCNAVENRDFGDDVNLGMNLDAGLSATEVRPKEKRHAKVDGGGVNSEETPVQFELFGDAFLLCKRHHIESKFLKDKRVAEHVRVGKSAPADRRLAKTEIVASFSMGSDYIGEFPETVATYQLSEHEHQQMVPIRKSPSLCLVEMSLDYSSELPLRQKTRDLCENILPHKRLCTDFGSVAKMQISNPGQGVSCLTYCA